MKGLGREQYDDGFVMSDYEAKSLFYGLRWLASISPRCFWIDVFYEIPHSCFEYVMAMTG